jgi:hypothetical protein
MLRNNDMNTEKSKTKSWIIFFVMALAIIGIIGGYFYSKGNLDRQLGFDQNRKATPGPNDSDGFREQSENFQLDETKIAEIVSFFDSTSDMEEIGEYCSQEDKSMSCFYYCREINPSHEICSQIQPVGGPPEK